MLIRLTKTIQEKFKGITLVPPDTFGENRYAEWSADIFMIGTKKYFLVSNVYSMISVYFSVKEGNNPEKFVTAAVENIKKLCEEKGWLDLYEKYIFPYTKNIVFSKTNDKSVIAKMNGLKSCLPFYDTFAKERVVDSFCKSNMKNLGGQEYGTPEKVFVSDYMNKPCGAQQKFVKTVQKKPVKITKVYRFYAELNEFTPKVYRRFLIRSDETFMTLASLLMSIFNCNGSHIYEFNIPVAKNRQKQMEKMGCPKDIINDFIQAPLRDILVQIYIDSFANKMDQKFALKNGLPVFDYCDAREVKLYKEITAIGDEMNFVYDLGDSWRFTLTLENIFEDKEHSEKQPCVLEGAGLGIIEDSGGVSALMDIRKAFIKKSGSLYEEISEWLDRENLDLDFFDIEDCNKNLKSSIRRFNANYRYMN